MADRDLSTYDAALATRVLVIAGLDARLAAIDTNASDDKYVVMQGLKDQTKKDDPDCCYLYTRQGGTGSRGGISLVGPVKQPEVARDFAKRFKELTDFEWGSVEPGHRANPGKYWLQQRPLPELGVVWQYFVNDRVDGKFPGWYSYAESASVEVEELYAQHVANCRESRTATRIVRSDYFTYKVDLEAMTQENLQTHKVRTIRRAGGVVEAQAGAGVGALAKFSFGTLGGASIFGSAPAPLFGTPSFGKVPALSFGKVPALGFGTLFGKPMKAKRSKKGLGAKKKTKKQQEALKLKRKKLNEKLKAKVARRAKKAKEALKKKKAKEAVKARKAKIGSRSEVLRGKKQRTKTGLKADDLMKNKDGKVVTKRKSAIGRKHFCNIALWVSGVKQARKELGVSGFAPVRKGTDLYTRAKELMPSMQPMELA